MPWHLCATRAVPSEASVRLQSRRTDIEKPDIFGKTGCPKFRVHNSHMHPVGAVDLSPSRSPSAGLKRFSSSPTPKTLGPYLNKAGLTQKATAVAPCMRKTVTHRPNQTTTLTQKACPQLRQLRTDTQGSTSVTSSADAPGSFATRRGNKRTSTRQRPQSKVRPISSRCISFLGDVGWWTPYLEAAKAVNVEAVLPLLAPSTDWHWFARESCSRAKATRWLREGLIHGGADKNTAEQILVASCRVSIPDMSYHDGFTKVEPSVSNDGLKRRRRPLVHETMDIGSWSYSAVSLRNDAGCGIGSSPSFREKTATSLSRKRTADRVNRVLLRHKRAPEGASQARTLEFGRQRSRNFPQAHPPRYHQRRLGKYHQECPRM